MVIPGQVFLKYLFIIFQKFQQIYQINVEMRSNSRQWIELLPK